MARAICRWTPPTELANMLRDAGRNVGDLSVSMEKIARMGYEEISQRLARGGDGDWPALSPNTIRRWGDHPIGIGKHGGFARWLRRDWNTRGAVVINAAPHAHLFDEGTADHYVRGRRTGVYSQGGQRRSRPESRRLLHHGTSVTHQPERPFMYFSDRLQEQAGYIVIAGIFSEFGVEAAA